MTLESLTMVEVVDSRSALVETDASLVVASTDRRVRLKYNVVSHTHEFILQRFSTGVPYLRIWIETQTIYTSSSH